MRWAFILFATTVPSLHGCDFPSFADDDEPRIEDIGAEATDDDSEESLEEMFAELEDSTGPSREETAADRRVFDGGRYAMRFPVELELESERSEDSTRYDFSALHEGSVYALLFFVYDTQRHEVDDRGYLQFESRRFVESQGGREATEREVDIGGRTGVVSRFVTTPTERDRPNELVAFAADRTLFLLHVVGPAAGRREGLELARSFEVLRERPDVAPEEPAEPERSLMDELAGRLPDVPRATPEEIAAAPRSTAPGEPSVASSCNQISLMNHCYETASSTGARGFYSSASACGAPHRFSDEPCPREGRTGSCILSGGWRDLPPYAQVAHFYGDSGDLRALCEETYEGEYRPAAPPVYPRNAP